MCSGVSTSPKPLISIWTVTMRWSQVLEERGMLTWRRKTLKPFWCWAAARRGSAHSQTHILENMWHLFRTPPWRCISHQQYNSLSPDTEVCRTFSLTPPLAGVSSLPERGEGPDGKDAASACKFCRWIDATLGAWKILLQNQGVQSLQADGEKHTWSWENGPCY